MSDDAQAANEGQSKTLDLTDPVFLALATSARRIEVLFANPKVCADIYMTGCLDDFLGAIYALVFAKEGQFEDRIGKPIEPKALSTRAEQLGKGQVRVGGKWMAGFYFNSALLRISAVYHRSLKVVAGQPATKTKYVGDLKPDAEALYLKEVGTAWQSAQLQSVHDEVNDLKHTAKGIYDGRNVTFQNAMSAVEELLTLIEAWAK